MTINLIADKKWRMNHLYRIINKDGDSIPFKLNPVQQEVLDNLHQRNLILKARQLGMSTFAVIHILDEALFNENLSAGIVSYSLDHAEHIFKRIIGHAIDSLTPMAQKLAGIVQRSATSITLANGSYLKVGTTLRGGTLQLLLVSEFGKTCARNPLKAEEVVTGTLNALPKTGTCIIESTGEGNEGYYAEMVNNAVERGNDDLSSLEYKLFFFNWLKEPNYTMDKDVRYGENFVQYFEKLEKKLKIVITKQQRNWYVTMAKTQGDKMKQEYPSTVSEAFISSSDAYYFQQPIEKAYQENRCLRVSLYDALEPVYVAMDIGATDLTVMIFYQVVHGEIRVIDYYEDNNKDVPFYAKFLLQDKPYLYRKIFLPHDSTHKNAAIIHENTYKRQFDHHFRHAETQIVVLPRSSDKNLLISNAKIKVDRCVFNLNKVKGLIDHLTRYRKKWSEQYGKYLDTEYEDINCHFADAFIYAMQSITHIEAVGSQEGALKRHKEMVERVRLNI